MESTVGPYDDMTYEQVKEVARDHVRKEIYEKTKTVKATYSNIPSEIRTALSRAYMRENHADFLLESDKRSENIQALNEEEAQLSHRLGEVRRKLEEELKAANKSTSLRFKYLEIASNPPGLFDGLDQERKKRLKEAK